MPAAQQDNPPPDHQIPACLRLFSKSCHLPPQGQPFPVAMVTWCPLISGPQSCTWCSLWLDPAPLLLPTLFIPKASAQAPPPPHSSLGHGPCTCRSPWLSPSSLSPGWRSDCSEPSYTLVLKKCLSNCCVCEIWPPRRKKWPGNKEKSCIIWLKGGVVHDLLVSKGKTHRQSQSC